MINTDYKIIENLLEEIFLNQEELEKVKHEIHQVSLGKLDPKQLRRTILESRIRLLNEMINDFLPYYKSQIRTPIIESPKTSNLLKKLREREELLEIIASKLNALYNKLEGNKKPEDLNYTQDIYKISEKVSKISSAINIKEDHYYNNISVPENTLFVDITNVLHRDKDENGKLKSKNIMKVITTLTQEGYHPILWADANTKYLMDDKLLYEFYVSKKDINVVPANRKADIYILKLAKKYNCKFLALDLYRDYWSDFGEDWVKNNRVTCIWTFNGDLIID
ncbi:MAG: hypothetical protein ACFE9T_06060 [Promethearchaeota archaeon]